MERIAVSGPSITQREIDYVTDAVTHGWFARAGEYAARFERAFAEYVGVRHAVSTPSCTSALHLALCALGVGPGDEVIVPECTWIATAAPVTYVGATPVFADIERDTWCLSARSVAQNITPRTRAIIPVDLYGGTADYAALRAACGARTDIRIIEDAAEAIGSEAHGRRAGSLGDVGTFSFHGSKTLTTGEGGMLVTDDDAVHARVLRLRDHGRAPGDTQFVNYEVGFKYKMSALQAALGLAQIERAEELVARKRETFGWYRDRLADLPDVKLNAEPPGTRNTYWMVTAMLAPENGLTKAVLGARLDRAGIDTRPFFHPLSSQPAFAHAPGAARARARNEVAYAVAPLGINLPSGLDMTESKVDRVCDALRAVLRGGA